MALAGDRRSWNDTARHTRRLCLCCRHRLNPGQPVLALALASMLFPALAGKPAAHHDASSMLSAEAMTDRTFSALIAANGGGGGRAGEGWFVLFYMPWCGYCKEVLPVWDRLAEELKGECGVGKVNLEAENAVKYRLRRKVVSYPTMVFIRNNVSTTYTGTRDINHLKEFARGGYKGAPKEASAPLPPDPATWTLLQTSLALAEDFVLEMAASYSGIWQAYRNEFLAAISTAFSMGGIFGFFLKILIDSCLFPQVPPRRHAVALPPRAKTKTT